METSWDWRLEIRVLSSFVNSRQVRVVGHGHQREALRISELADDLAGELAQSLRHISTGEG